MEVMYRVLIQYSTVICLIILGLFGHVNSRLVASPYNSGFFSYSHYLFLCTLQSIQVCGNLIGYTGAAGSKRSNANTADGRNEMLDVGLKVKWGNNTTMVKLFS